MSNNPYLESQEQAGEYLRLALLLLSKHKIPVSPLNYRMGYDCAAGHNEILKKALESAAGRTDKALSEHLWETYQDSYIQDNETLDSIRQELALIISNMRLDMERSGGALSSYAARLTQFLNMLGTSPSRHMMETEVKKVIDDTRAVEESHRQHEAQIAQISSELESIRSELAEVKQASLIDSLTGISNRKSFDTRLEQTIGAAREDGSVLSLLLVDIDNFKLINDSYGHLVGDKVLRFVASTMKKNIKGNDVVARFGGEEFAVILPHTDLAGAYTVAEQIRQAISSSRLKDLHTGKAYSRVTVSVGIAGYGRNDLPNELVERADQALYAAKNGGRNRVERAA
jgi:diguanylate cyclase